MKQLALGIFIAFITQSCGLAALALLGGTDIDDLAENFEESIETQQRLAEYAMAAARGELPAGDYSYDPPSQANGMIGTLTQNGADLSFGTGDIAVRFQVDGDGIAIDPYSGGIDMASLGAIDGSVQISFHGISPNGKSLGINADVDMSTIQNSATDVQAVLAGRWEIDLDSYDTTLTTDSLQLDIDLVTDEVTNAIGTIDGNIDIPNFPIDGNFTVEGLGDQLEVAIDVAVTEIDFIIDLVDIF